jgi:hypothetical protein
MSTGERDVPGAIRVETALVERSMLLIQPWQKSAKK